MSTSTTTDPFGLPLEPSYELSGRPSTAASSDGRGSVVALTQSHAASTTHNSRVEVRRRTSGNRSVLSEPSTSSPTNGKSKILRRAKSVQWFLIDQWFLISLGVLIAISSQVQVPASKQQLKQTIVTYAAVAVIFGITGATLPTRVLLNNYSRWRIHLFVQIQCFLLASAVCFGVVSACATNPDFMDPFLLIGFLFVGSVATTIASNVVMTRQAHGNASLTVVESTIGNFLGPFLTPVLVSMYTSTDAWYTHALPASKGSYGEIYRRVFKQLGLSLFLPMFVGQIVQNVFPKTTKKVFTDWKLNKLGSIALLSIIWQTYDQAFETGAFTSVKGNNMVFVVFISIAIFILLLLVCFTTSILWLPKKDTISVCYCVPAKTPAMGVPITAVMYVGLSRLDESKIQIPMVIYQGLQIVFSSLLTIAHRRWIRPDEEREEREKKEQENADVGDISKTNPHQ